jgi:hypothetical protein
MTRRLANSEIISRADISTALKKRTRVSQDYNIVPDLDAASQEYAAARERFRSARERLTAAAGEVKRLCDELAQEALGV